MSAGEQMQTKNPVPIQGLFLSFFVRVLPEFSIPYGLIYLFVSLYKTAMTNFRASPQRPYFFQDSDAA